MNTHEHLMLLFWKLVMVRVCKESSLKGTQMIIKMKLHYKQT